MMLAKMHFPEILKPDELDEYLAMGWFRMRQTIFTTNFLCFSDRFYSAIWLRIALDKFEPDKKHLELYKRNAQFTTKIQRAQITDQHEALFHLYKHSVSFEAAENLQKLLFGNENTNLYDTYTASVYDGNLLIGVGFFDLGKSSAAGITSIYHPAYKKYSLGKYLIYLKIDYCRKRKFQYFYPGYIVPGYAAFDYKIDIGKSYLEWLELSSQRWLSYDNFSRQAEPLNQMRIRLSELHRQLESRGIASAVMYYRFFDVRLDPSYGGIELFDFPLFLYFKPPPGSSKYRLIVFDVRDGKYHFVQCSPLVKIGFQQEDDAIFSSDLLKMDRLLLNSSRQEEVIQWLLQFL